MALWLNRPFMSIATKSGDAGTTALMFNRRVSKSHPRVEAYGCVDELNAAMGLARATAEEPSVRENLMTIQKDLVTLMAELATHKDDMERFIRSGLARVTADTTAKLDRFVQELESKNIRFQGWATPGATLHAAALDMARTICRRAERRVCALQNDDELRNPEIIPYLNRLSDLLWLLARSAESPPPVETQLV